MKILGINTNFNYESLENYSEDEITSQVSLLDYDTIIISTNFLHSHYDYSGTHLNAKNLSKDASFQIKQDYEKLKKEIIELLKMGKRIYIILDKNPPCYVFTGKTETKGTGKNAQTTNYVELFDTFSFLPIEFKFTDSRGEELTFCKNTPYYSFLKKQADNFLYAGYFSLDNALPLAHIKNTNVSIAAEVPFEQGKIIFLPSLKDDDDYNSPEEYDDALTNFIDNFFLLEEELNKQHNHVLPDWSLNFQYGKEKIIRNDMVVLQEKLQAIQADLENTLDKLDILETYKQLFTASGEALEKIVQQIFFELGFVFEETERNRTDLIAKYGEKAFVIEIKGLTKSAGEKNSAQLEKWSSEYLEHHGSVAKPILIVNAYKDTPLDKRTEPAFPNQMIPYATKRDHCLVTGLQLLGMYIDIEANPEKKDAILEDFFETIGVYQHYSDYRDFLEAIDEEQN